MSPPRILPKAIVAYLVVLPVGHLLVLPTLMNGADLALGLVLAIWIWEGRPFSIPRWAWLLLAYVAWIGVGALWSPYPSYAVAKAMAALAFTLFLLALARSGLAASRMADAWLMGTALCLAVTMVGGLLPLPYLHGRVLYEGGGLSGLPFLRVRGPFLHPNMLGDYLVLSGVLLWARWPRWMDRSPIGSIGFLAAFLGALLWSVSPVMVGAGVALALLGWRGSGVGRLLIPLGVGLSVVTLAALLNPFELGLGPLTLTSIGNRPQIWASALDTLLRAPIVGVGAVPVLAKTTGVGGEGPVSWDAHNALLSVWAQYGLVGMTLLAGGVGLLVRRLSWTKVTRLQWAVVAGLAAAAAHGLVTASEDLRHLWVFLGFLVLMEEGGGED